MNKKDDSLKGIKILVVDNDDKIIDLLSDILGIFGFDNIATAHDGKSAIKRMEEQSFDIVVCDWQMQPMDGIEFVDYIRTNPDSPDCYVPIIMLSGKADKPDIEKARDTGVTEFLAKPFSASFLRNRIISVIERPREFVFSSEYYGPSRRRRIDSIPDGAERRDDE